MLGKLAKLLLALLCIACLAGFAWMEQNDFFPKAAETAAVVSETVPKQETQLLEDEHLHESKLLYAHDEDTSVVTMYLTVSRGNAAENTHHSWEEINAYSAYDYEEMGIDRYQIAALLQVGDENGPLPGELGYGESVPNATVQIRGQASSRYQQKNYKIQIKEGKGVWHNQRTIALNKHVSDHLRFRNKLSFDLLEDIPQLLSLRTQFVHLYVKDTTGDNPDEFVDYGLYTQVEQLNGRAMRAHGLDENGHLYKINYFSFEKNEEIRLETDPLFDKAAFEYRLEPKGSHDHAKLLRMIDAVNDVNVSVEELFDTYFDIENLTYWMAFETLIGNTDTINRNVYLYSPLNSERWYMIPWDHDGSFMMEEYAMLGRNDRTSWQVGVSNYWGNTLFQRCLKSAFFRTHLEKAMQELRALMTPEKLNAMVQRYSSTVKPYAFSYPDNKYIQVTPEQYDQLAASIASEVEINYQLYLESFERPMPFFISEPVEQAGKIRFEWIPSYDFDGEDIAYRFVIARDYRLEDKVYEQQGIVFPAVELALKEPGQYFVYVCATNESGCSQEALDYYVYDGSSKAYGVRSFYIMEDGSVATDDYEE